MSKSLSDALGNGAWSVSAVVCDLNDMLDDEGRPIAERRADAAVRAGVEMEMKACPYGGIREGRLMNVSALVQVSQYFSPVMAEIAAFRRQAGGAQPTWGGLLACVVDQLSRPAIYLLLQRSLHGPVPAQMAVGHKLAAGFFGVMRGVHERLALGDRVPLTVDAFLGLVDEMGALLGASEACAGSPAMIRKATTALVEGEGERTVELDRSRIEIARRLALQVQTGIFWDLYDRVHLWSLLCGGFSQHLHPCNMFLARKLESEQSGLGKQAPRRPQGEALPAALDAPLRARLAHALRDDAGAQALEEDMGAISGLLGAQGNPVGYDGAPAPLAAQAASYLHTRRLFVAELSRLELDLRRYLNYPADAPIRLGTAALPRSQALPWYELMLGRHLGADGRLTGGAMGARVAAMPAQGGAAR